MADALSDSKAVHVHGHEPSIHRFDDDDDKFTAPRNYATPVPPTLPTTAASPRPAAARHPPCSKNKGLLL